MGVDFEAFATAFAGTLAKDITARKAKTEEYGEKQRELAEKNKGVIAQRRQLKQSAMGLANQAKSLLATPEMISAALDSGADGLPKLVQSLTKARSVHGDRWDQQKANTVVSLPEGYTIPEGDLESRIAKSYGLGEAALGSTEAPERSFWDKGLGRGGRQAVRAELDEEAFYSGYSVMDINEIAAQEDYKSLTGGTFLNYAMPNVFDPDNISGELKVFNDMRSATKTSPAYEALNAQLKVKREAETKDMSVEEAEAIAKDIKGIEASMLALEYDAMREFATAQVDRFGESYIDAMGPVLSGTFPNLLTTGTDEVEPDVEMEATTDTAVTIQGISEDSNNTVTVDTETGNATIQLNTPNEMFGETVTAQTDPEGSVVRLVWTNDLGETQSVTDPATIKMILKEIETPTAKPVADTSVLDKKGFTPDLTALEDVSETESTALEKGLRVNKAVTDLVSSSEPFATGLVKAAMNTDEKITAASAKALAVAADFFTGLLGGTEQTSVSKWLKSGAADLEEGLATDQDVRDKAIGLANAFVEGMGKTLKALTPEEKAEATESLTNVLTRGSDTPAAKALVEAIQERVDYARNKRAKDSVETPTAKPDEATEEGTPVSAPEAEAVVAKHGSDILKFLRSKGFTSEDTEEDIVQGLEGWYSNNSTDLSIKPAPTDLSPVAYVMKLMLDKG